MKNKLLKIACLSAALLLTGCDSITATPKNANDALITFNDGSVYFQNNYQKVLIYDTIYIEPTQMVQSILCCKRETYDLTSG